MHRSNDLDVEVIRLASNLPVDTVVIVAKRGTLKLHTVLRGRREVSERLLSEVKELDGIFADSDDDNK